MDLEDIRKGESTDNSLDIYECLSAVEKSITLLGQAYTTTTYHRGMNVLYNLTKDVKKAKNCLNKMMRNCRKATSYSGKNSTKPFPKLLQ